MGKPNSINPSVLLGALAALLYVSPGAWGQEDGTGGENMLKRFKAEVKKGECVKLLWISSLLDYGNNKDIQSCLRDDTRGGIEDILAFVNKTSSEDPTVKTMCTNLQKVVNCYVPDEEACKVVTDNTETYYSESMCNKPGDNYRDVKDIKEFGNKFKDCFRKFHDLDDSTETGKCLTRVDIPANSKTEQKLCLYSKTAAGCLENDTTNICGSTEVKESLVKSLKTIFAASYCTREDEGNNVPPAPAPAGKVDPPPKKPSAKGGANFGQEKSQTLTILTISIVSVMAMALE